MKRLNKLAVLAIDCQATHSNPAIGHLAKNLPSCAFIQGTI